MTQETDREPEAGLTLEYVLDAAPEKVWRALTIGALRERWLSAGATVDPVPLASIEGEEVRYRMRDDMPPFLESEVTFQLRPDEAGGTRLTIVHTLTDVRLVSAPKPANANRPPLMRAA
ncbi:SRPBCC family protein [Jiella avicenniae]|uniref:SRPBCC domain-containing protein n=1 Tax=Jiella avicenniae TaxID=2907202 RepID=A0A9X1T9S7_9HYPH|nr:SRPBCC domain-containing protein [Jiella avicenniae]MCE7026608.1 SRPBCC domain-containing protein [Jiella avicenniae]